MSHRKIMSYSTFPNRSHDGTQEDIRILLVGRSGAGKSASANTIAGENYFVSKVNKGSDTTCKHVIVNRFDTNIMIIDTPGYFDTAKPKQELLQEMAQLFAISSPGPHAIVCVVPFGRLTAEDMDSINLIQLAFGKNMLKYTLVLFTRLDDLDDDDVTVEKYIRYSGKELKTFLDRCENRHVEFNNKADKQTKEMYAKRFLDKVKTITEANQNIPFSNEKYRYIEEKIQEEIIKRIEIQTYEGNTQQWPDDAKVRQEIRKEAESSNSEFVSAIQSPWSVSNLVQRCKKLLCACFCYDG